MISKIQGTRKGTERGSAIEVTLGEFHRVKREQGGMTQGFQVELNGKLFDVTGRGKDYKRAGTTLIYFYVTSALVVADPYRITVE